jgi:nitroreductase
LRAIRSGRTFVDAPVTDDELALLLEAGRWAPSSWNHQPWRFVVVRQGSPAHAQLGAALSASNQRWALHAPVLVVVAACLHAEDGTLNPHALHDTGLATGLCLVQAVDLDLHVQIMAGFDGAEAARAVQVPSGHEVATVLAIGHIGPTSLVPVEVAARELRPRRRRPLTDLVFEGGWGRSFEPRLPCSQLETTRPAEGAAAP